MTRIASTGIPTTVLVAPDSFKGTLSAPAVAGAIARGLQAGNRPVDLCPVADGGEGTLAALRLALGVQERTARVTDPLGREIDAAFGVAAARGQAGAAGTRRGASLPTQRRGPGPVAIVEAAAASGLGLVAADERDAGAATTFGTGELILAAVGAGAEIVYVGVGGSATTDGGAGAIRAIRAGGGLGGARLVVLCDVRTPFEDAARVFGPQKGADPADVRRLSARLHAFARRLDRDPRGLPMTGAAGGLAGGLWAVFGAELVPGASFVLDAVGFPSRLRVARAVVTGEGQLDQQSLAGKAVSEVATRARQSGVPCYAIVGRRELDSFGTRILDLEAVLEAGTLPAIERAGRDLARLL